MRTAPRPVVATALGATEGRIQMDEVLEACTLRRPCPCPSPLRSTSEPSCLRRDRGNLLVCSAPGLPSDARAFEHLGGVSRHYLNHRHEAMFASDPLPAPSFVHQDERASVARRPGVRATFARRHTLDDDFEVIPTPGHTSGATAFLWDSGRHRFLFTGDTIHLSEGEWAAALLRSSDRAAYLKGLELIGGLEFDVLVLWAATGGRPCHSVTDQVDARRRIDAIRARIRRGENHR